MPDNPAPSKENRWPLPFKDGAVEIKVGKGWSYLIYTVLDMVSYHPDVPYDACRYCVYTARFTKGGERICSVDTLLELRCFLQEIGTFEAITVS